MWSATLSAQHCTASFIVLMSSLSFIHSPSSVLCCCLRSTISKVDMLSPPPSLLLPLLMSSSLSFVFPPVVIYFRRLENLLLHTLAQASSALASPIAQAAAPRPRSSALLLEKAVDMCILLVSASCTIHLRKFVLTLCSFLPYFCLLIDYLLPMHAKKLNLRFFLYKVHLA